MTAEKVIEAAESAMCNLGVCGDLGPSVRLEMCFILGCDPCQLDRLLDDDELLLACLGY